MLVQVDMPTCVLLSLLSLWLIRSTYTRHALYWNSLHAHRPHAPRRTDLLIVVPTFQRLIPSMEILAAAAWSPLSTF